MISDEDVPKRSWVICKHVLIWFKHEYRRLTLLSRCDVIRDVINTKIHFLGYFAYVFPYLMSRLKNWKILKSNEILRSTEDFVKSVTENWVCYLDKQQGHSLHFDSLSGCWVATAVFALTTRCRTLKDDWWKPQIEDISKNFQYLSYKSHSSFKPVWISL